MVPGPSAAQHQADRAALAAAGRPHRGRLGEHGPRHPLHVRRRRIAHRGRPPRGVVRVPPPRFRAPGGRTDEVPASRGLHPLRRDHRAPQEPRHSARGMGHDARPAPTGGRRRLGMAFRGHPRADGAARSRPPRAGGGRLLRAPHALQPRRLPGPPGLVRGFRPDAAGGDGMRGAGGGLRLVVAARGGGGCRFARAPLRTGPLARRPGAGAERAGAGLRSPPQGRPASGGVQLEGRRRPPLAHGGRDQRTSELITPATVPSQESHENDRSLSIPPPARRARSAGSETRRSSCAERAPASSGSST